MKHEQEGPVQDLEKQQALHEEKEELLELLRTELEKVRNDSIQNVRMASDYKKTLAIIAEKLVKELNQEEYILHQYEGLSKKYEALKTKYDALVRSPLVKLIYFSWNVYNKIKYNKKPQFK